MLFVSPVCFTRRKAAHDYYKHNLYARGVKSNAISRRTSEAPNVLFKRIWRPVRAEASGVRLVIVSGGML
jgi:hypothetical protein